MCSNVDVVTGSFSYSGQYITRKLLLAGRQVRTLTGHPQPDHPLAGQVRAFAYHFHQPDRLAETLEGADTLYNTYWVRFPHGGLNYEVAVENSRVLFQAAVRAGIRKIVHVSIINPAEDSPYAYFRGKACVERALRESGLAHTILRPTVVFGPEDILINNIAWMLRTFPIFLLPRSGDSLIQPIYVEDLAQLAVTAAASSSCDVIDAVGPETFSYRELVRFIAQCLGRSVPLVRAPVPVVYALGRAMGWFVRDVILTYEEILALADGLLHSVRPPTGATSLRDWLAAEKDRVGCQYRSELRRHFA
ncbi:MAG TPA: NAD(P)H-binding protein [Bryobacteraceae bacterium]|nr:NAD(P)H-binding protein [Bryobacteraceae bacterium]